VGIEGGQILVDSDSLLIYNRVDGYAEKVSVLQSNLTSIGSLASLNMLDMFSFSLRADEIDQIFENRDYFVAVLKDNARVTVSREDGLIKEVVQSATDLAGDRFISYSTWKWSDMHEKSGTSPVYRYFYTHPRPPMKPEYAGMQPGLAGGLQERDEGDDNSVESFPEPQGAAHAVEIEYIMGNLPSNEVFAWTEEDYKVSNIFQGYAANFVKFRDPNGLGLPFWPAVNSGERKQVIHIGPETVLRDEKHRERYLFLDKIHFPEE
jgi:carboxylesterase type B